MTDESAVIVAGPTASGKSALALALAQRIGGTIINADSMQVYRELRVLTARPTAEEAALVPHALYGVRGAAEPGSVAWWAGAAEQAIADSRAAGRRPILCGGTGLYFAALIGGLAAIPDPGPTARTEARALLAELGPGGLHARLAAVDPATAERIRPADRQRVARAWEVWRGTGMGLAAWQARQPDAVEQGGCVAIMLDPPRPVLREAIARRFAAMLVEGAIDEVRQLLALGLDPALPAMRAHGVPELTRHLRGQITLAEAAGRAIVATGRYTKRQTTWFRHHRLASAARTHTIHARFAGVAQFSETEWAEIVDFVCALS